MRMSLVIVIIRILVLVLVRFLIDGAGRPGMEN